MKKINFILFFCCLIQVIFSGTVEGYIITLESEINSIGCDINSYKLIFSFNAYTSGFESGGTFDLKLHYPDYAIAECQVPASIEGQMSIITCGINTFIFPLFNDNAYLFPMESEINSLITFENWDQYIGGRNLNKLSECEFQYNYVFTKNLDESFSVEIDYNSGIRYLRGRGSFEDLNPTIKSNYLSSSDPLFYFKTFIYVDDGFKENECEIYISDETINSGDYEIHCLIAGNKKAVFFPTLGYSKVETEPGNIRLNIYEEVDLSGTFSKLSALLLLSFLLL